MSEVLAEPAPVAVDVRSVSGSVVGSAELPGLIFGIQPNVPVMPVACGPQMVLPGRPPAGGPIYQSPPAYRGPELTITPSRISMSLSV